MGDHHRSSLGPPEIEPLLCALDIAIDRDQPLKSLAALALDCQTTGANAGRDHLLEIGWVSIGPGPFAGRCDPSAHLVTLPEGVKLPSIIARLTGVREDDFRTALSLERVWGHLVEAVDALAASPAAPKGVVLIHYARFERPFLQRLHARCGDGGAFPFQIVCTHTIARRLLPHLPRCGLRALAGYFGYPLDDRKRAASHARATGVIWENLIPLLAAEGIRKWSALAAWLDRPRPSGRGRKSYPMPRALRLETPDHPGVYRLRRSNGDLLYVGKARSLKRRINSYFQSRRRHPEHILEMLTQARDLDFTPTPTALEAALLEADLIKQAAPPYNILLKPRETAPVFFADDFQTAGAPDHPGLSVGPLPSERTLTAFRFVLAQCGRSNPALPTETQELAAGLDIPKRYLPPRSLLAEGLDAYREACGYRGDLRRTGRQLLKRGLILWRLRKNNEARVEEDDDPAPLDAGDEKEWTAAAVMAMLDGIVRRGSHLVRRGRWLQILANATLCWETPDQKNSPKRILHIQHGRIRPAPERSVTKGLKAPSPAPPTRMAGRQIFSSAATYDRLRVLTTELRRLAGENRRLQILPSVGGPIANRGLVRLFDLI